MAYIFQPGNIWSGDKKLAVLTNPTSLAKRKGNLKKDYPIRVKGLLFADVEAAYQTLKEETLSLHERKTLMVELLKIKLSSYQEVFEAVENSGGVGFLEKCSHHVYGKGLWEGVGRKSLFISCLITAYESIMEGD